MSADAIKHRITCADPKLKEQTRRGVRILRCCTCSQFVPIPESPPHVAVSRLVSSRYVCRDHLEEPVTWRGTGCAECASERVRRRHGGGGRAGG